jgi:hypothetical protein
MKGKKKSAKKYPIRHWSHSSLMAFLRNPLAWYKRYVEEVYDTPRTPASIIGSAGHVALENYYSDVEKEIAIAMGLEYLRAISDADIDFGKANPPAGGAKARRKKREAMERDYLQAIGFYLAKPPKHKVLGVEVKGTVKVAGLPLPLKAVSDLVVVSTLDKNAVDIVDHKFVAAFTKGGATKPIFAIQAIFNYYTVRTLSGKLVKRFIVYECKKTRNADGSKQVRRYVFNFDALQDEFEVFRRLITDATAEISRRRIYLPNPSDMFEGDNSFDIYRLGLVDE